MVLGEFSVLEVPKASSVLSVVAKQEVSSSGKIVVRYLSPSNGVSFGRELGTHSIHLFSTGEVLEVPHPLL